MLRLFDGWALFLLLKVLYYAIIILGVCRLIRGAFAPTFISRRKCHEGKSKDRQIRPGPCCSISCNCSRCGCKILHRCASGLGTWAHGLKRLCACFYIEEGALWKKNLIILYFSNRQFRE